LGDAVAAGSAAGAGTVAWAGSAAWATDGLQAKMTRIRQIDVFMANALGIASASPSEILRRACIRTTAALYPFVSGCIGLHPWQMGGRRRITLAA
jgi:hypothetical protein